jgi:hypothetical protein
MLLPIKILMNRTLAFFFLIAAPAFAACSAGGAAGALTGAPTAEPTQLRVTLPPAWTVTPTVTPIPATPTPSPTPHPAILAARQTAALWPTLHVVAVGAGADSSSWQRIDFETGSFLVPPTFEAADLGGVDDVIVLFMQAFAVGLVEMMDGMATPVPGAATSTPISLDELDSAFDFDFLVAADPRGEGLVYLVGEPLPQGFDLESMMTEAVGSLTGEVEVLGREIVGGASRNTGRVLLRLRDPAKGTTEDQVMYVIVDGERAWTLAYQARDFEAMLPLFETSALSLVPAP